MDTETGSSEDDVEISYSEVTFRAKPRHETVCSSDPRHRRAGHSSSSDEEDYTTQYTDVKISEEVSFIVKKSIKVYL